MNNIKFLLLGTSLSLIPNLTQAQCVATTDCATLGYTEKSCPDGKGLKCPFGNTFAIAIMLLITNKKANINIRK